MFKFFYELISGKFRMKIFFSKKYSKVRIRSVDQLKDDFGSFPPKPLNCIEPKNHLDIITVSKIGYLIYSFGMVVRVSGADKSRVSEALRDNPQLTQTVLSLKKSRDSISDLKKEFKSLNKFQGAFLLLLFSVLAVVLSIFILPYFLYIYGRACRDILSEYPKFAGFFMPVLNDEFEFVLKHGQDPGRVEAVKSHEHIHLLQYISRRNLGYENTGLIRLNSPQDFLDEENSSKDYILYLFNLDETEARLHEVVLSYYRSVGELPKSVSEFIAMLRSEEGIFKVSNHYFSDGISLFEGCNIECHSFAARDRKLMRDLLFQILSLKDEDIQVRFISEVLPVMYGKLMGYYGDADSSVKFLESIPRPNLYDRFYGGVCSAVVN